VKNLLLKSRGILSFVAFILVAAMATVLFTDQMNNLAQLAYQLITLDTLKDFVPSSFSMGGVGMAMAGLAVIKTSDKDEFEIKSPEVLEKLNDEEKSKYLGELINAQSKGIQHLQTEAKNLKENETEAKTAAEKMINELTELKIKTLTASLQTMGEKVTGLVKEVEAKTAGKSLGLKAAILEALEKNADDLKGFGKEMKSLSIEVPEFVTKASQNPGDITSGSDFAQMEPGVGQIATRQPFMRSLFVNSTTNKEYVKYNDQETVTRDAKNVANCAASTHTSKITWEVRTMEIKKVRDFVDVCIDMMEDYDFVTGEITNLVGTDVALKVDSQLLLGDGTGANLDGVASIASTFAAGDYAGEVQAATLFDLLTVAAAQIADAGQNNKFMANVAILNPIDATLMRLNKNVDNNYLLPNFVSQNGTQLGGLRIIENQLVPVGQAYVMDSTKGTVYSRKGITIDFGFENNDNFEREIVTVKAYERLNLRVRNVDANAFLHIPDLGAAIIAITEV
jgi:hypothetical protein